MSGALPRAHRKRPCARHTPHFTSHLTRATPTTTLRALSIKEALSNCISSLHAKFKEAKASSTATGGGASGSMPADGVYAAAALAGEAAQLAGSDGERPTA